jgi:hypothetical protein
VSCSGRAFFVSYGHVRKRYGDELVMPESDGGSTPKRARTDADGDGEGDDAESAEWLFNCICGERVRSSAPVERHPQGE